MMNTRALMELIVINVGYDLGVISQQVFTMLVLMAIFSTVITTPGLRRWLPKMGGGGRGPALRRVRFAIARKAKRATQPARRSIELPNHPQIEA